MPKVAAEPTIPNRVTRSLRNRLVSVDSDNSRSSTPVNELSPISEKEKKRTSSSSPKTRTTRKDVSTPAKAISRGRRASLSEAETRTVPSPVRRKLRGASIVSEDEATTPSRTRSRKSPLIIDSPITEENGSPEKANVSKRRGRPPKDSKNEESNRETRKSDLSLKSKDGNVSTAESDVIINIDDSDEEEIKSLDLDSETKNAPSSDAKKGNKKMMVKLKQMSVKDKVQEENDNDRNNENIKIEVDHNKKKKIAQKKNKEYSKDQLSDDAEIECVMVESVKNSPKVDLSISEEKQADKTVDKNDNVEEENNLKENHKEKDEDDSKNLKENEILNQAEKDNENVTEAQGPDEVYIEKFEKKTVDLKASETSIEEQNTSKMLEELIDKNTDLEIEKDVEHSDVDTIDKEQIDTARQGKTEEREHVVEDQLEEKNIQAQKDSKIDTQGKDNVLKIISIDVIVKGNLTEAQKRDDENDIEKEILDKEEARIVNFDSVKNKNNDNEIQNQNNENILTSQKTNVKERKELQSVVGDQEQEDVGKVESVLEKEIISPDDENIINTNLNSNDNPEEIDVNSNLPSIEMEGIKTHNISMDKTDREEVSILSDITEDQNFDEGAKDSESMDLKKDEQHNINDSQEIQNKTLQEISVSYFPEQSEKNTTKDMADNDKSKKQKSVTFGTDNTDKTSINYPKTPLIMKTKSSSNSRSISVRCLDATLRTDTSTDISTLSKESDEHLQEKSNHIKIDENHFPDSDTPYKALRGKSSLSSSTPIATLKNQIEDGNENVGTLKQNINTLPNSIGENSSTNETESIISNEDMKKRAESDDLKATTNSSVKNDKGQKNSEYEFAKTWNQSVTVNVANDTNKGKYIDSYGLKTESKKEEKKVQSNGKKNVSDYVLLSDIENDEESESDHENRNEFIDDEAEEAEEENSLCSEERAYLEENEIPVDGISIGSEDTDADNEEEEDETDSFVISDNEENAELLSYDTEEIFSNSDDSSVKQKKRRKRVILLVSSGDEESDADDSKPNVKNSVQKLRNNKEKNPSDTSNNEANTTISTISNSKKRKSKERSESDSFNQKKQMSKNRSSYLASSSDEECNDNIPKAHNINTNVEPGNEENNKTIVNTKTDTKSDESIEMLSSSDNNADNVEKKATKKRSRQLVSSDDEQKCEEDIIVNNTSASEKIDVKNVTLKDKINVLEPISEDNETSQTFDINDELENIIECLSTDLNSDADTTNDPKSVKESESDHQSNQEDRQVFLKANTSTSQKSSEKEKDKDDSNLLEVSGEHQCSQENLQISLNVNTSTLQKSSEKEEDGGGGNLLQVSSQKDDDKVLQNSVLISQPPTSRDENSLEENTQKKESTAEEDCTNKAANRKLSFSSEQGNVSVSNTSANLLASATSQHDNTSIYNFNETLNIAETSICKSKESELLVEAATEKISSVCSVKTSRKSQSSSPKTRSKDIENDFIPDSDTVRNEEASSLKTIDKNEIETAINIEEKSEEEEELLEVNEKDSGEELLEVNENDSEVKRKSLFKNKSLELPRKRKLSNEQKILSSSFNCFVNDKAQDSSYEDSSTEEETNIEKKEAVAKAVKYAAFLLNKQIEELSMAKSKLEKKKANDENSFSFLEQESPYEVCSDKQKLRLLPDSILEALDDGPNKKSKKHCHNETQELADSKISPSPNSSSGKKRNKRKLIRESFEQAKSISEIKTSSGVFLEETIKEKRKKENKFKNRDKEEILSTIVLPTGLVYEQPLTPVHKKFVNGFEETIASPRPIGFKVKNILSAGQKEPPEYKKDTRRKRKLQLEEPTMVLPKPKWTNSGEFTVTKYPKRIKQHESEATEFMVAPLKTKKSKSITHVPLTVSSTALEFKKNALYSKQIPRETSKQLLQRKEKQKFYKF